MTTAAERCRKYRESAHGRKIRRLYARSKRGRAAALRYRTSKKGQAARRNWARKKKYGLPFEEFRDRWLRQGKRCGLCSRRILLFSQTWNSRAAEVDHDHVTNKVRALLCDRCNRMLALAKDSPDLLRDAAEYLERYK